MPKSIYHAMHKEVDKKMKQRSTPKPPKGGWVVNRKTGQFDDRENLSQLHQLILCNPILKIIKEQGAKSPKRVLFPGDSSCNYFFEYLEHFPEGTWAMPQVFCRLIKGLNSNHWLALTAMRFRERRHLAGDKSEYGMLRPKEVERLKQANPAFWEHYVQVRPDDVQMEKLKQRSNNRNKLLEESRGQKRKHGDEDDHGGYTKKKVRAEVSPSYERKIKSFVDDDEEEDDDYDDEDDKHMAAEGSNSRAVTPTSVPMASTNKLHANEGIAMRSAKGKLYYTVPGRIPNPHPRWKVTAHGQFDDRNNVEQLQEIVDMNPVLEFIQERGGDALKKDLFPEGDEFFYEFLENFPEGTWAVPQVFCRVIKKLSSGHWLTRMALRLKERRHKGRGEFGSLKPREVERIQKANPAFWHYYVDGKIGQPLTLVKTVKDKNVPDEEDEDDARDDSTHSSKYSRHRSNDGDSSRSAERGNEEATTESASAAKAPTSTILSDPVLQRQILQEHLMRSNLQQQQQRALLLQHFPEHAASLMGPPFGANAAAAANSGLGVLPNRDALPFLAANFVGYQGQQLGASAPASDAPQSNVTFQTLASLFASAGAPAGAGGNPGLQIISPSSVQQKQDNLASLAEVSDRLAEKESAKEGVHEAREQQDDGEAEAWEESRNSKTSFSTAAAAREDDTGAEAAPREWPRPARLGRGDFSMLDILAATASAARLEVVAD